MDTTALMLSRLQFAFTVSFHIIFPSFTIGLAAWLTVLETLHLITRRPVYRRVFDFWLKIFGIAFGMGVVSGIVLAFEFGTNWSELSRLSGPIQGPLLSYETFTAFMLEASFFGVLLFGRNKVKPGLYLFSAAMVTLGTTLSAFWIMVNNSWMQYPVGYTIQNGVYVPDNWAKIIFSPVVWVRFPHMLLAAYVTGAFCVAATGAWYALRGMCLAEGRVMLRMGLFLAAILLPVQLLFGHLVGDYVHRYQPIKFATIEARWHDEQPASEVLLAWPDAAHEKNDYAISVPVLGSLIASMSLDSKEVGLTDFPRSERPPIAIPFFTFRLMVGCGLLMLLVAWGGTLLSLKGRLLQRRALLWTVFLCFPLPFIATLTGWFTAEVGRQPWTVYGLLRTADAVTPFLTPRAAAGSLLVFCATYVFIFAFGTYYIYKLLKAGPTEDSLHAPPAALPNRPLSATTDLPSTVK
ncbi:cytochrome ubiquinol oxidase subunit I [Paraburkholderia aspalathi]|uniref:cytochrome ubiquinol oxidase subunit I n=1 Tax=Paraburkholderia aspalathi TaxID=1324617 RepID=UPI0038BD42E9